MVIIAMGIIIMMLTIVDKIEIDYGGDQQQLLCYPPPPPSSSPSPEENIVYKNL